MGNSFALFLTETESESDFEVSKKNNGNIVNLQESEAENDGPVGLYTNHDFKVTVNGVQYDWANLHTIEYLNSLNSFECDLPGVTQGDANVAENNIFRLYLGQTLIFKGILANPNFQTGGVCHVNGYDMAYLLQRANTNSMASARALYTNTPALYIVQDIATGVISLGVDNVTAPITCRGDYAARLAFVQGVANQVNKDWWVNQVVHAPYMPDANTMLLLHLDELAAGSPAYDYSANKNNSTSVSGTVGAAGAPLYYARLFIPNDYISFSAYSTLNIATNLTIEAYVLANTLGTTQTIACRYSGSGVNGYGLFVNATTGKLLFQIGSSGAWKTVVGSITVADGTYHHVAGTFDGSNLKIYVDGVLDGTTAYSGSIDGNNSDDFSLGRMYNVGLYLDGKLDEVRVSNSIRASFSVLTAGEFDVLNVSDIVRGAQTPSYPLSASGDTQTCSLSSRNRDVEHIYNSVTVLGYGDGVNQVVGHAAAFTLNTTKLSVAAITTDATLSVASTASFPASGTLLIGAEQITYSGKTGTTFTGCTRGANSTTATAHFINQMVFDYTYSETSPQTGSSIQIYGKCEKSFNDPTILAGTTDPTSTGFYPNANAQQIAENILSQRYLPNDVIVMSLADTRQTLPALGDFVTVNDADLGLNNDSSYRCVGKERWVDPQSGRDEIQVSVANLPVSFMEDVQKATKTTDSVAQYMQGSTTIDSSAFDGVASKDAPYYGVFNIPDETVSINQLKIRWFAQNYATYYGQANNGSQAWTTTSISTSFVKVCDVTAGGNTDHSNFVYAAASAIVASGTTPARFTLQFYNVTDSVQVGISCEQYINAVGYPISVQMIAPVDAYGKNIQLQIKAASGTTVVSNSQVYFSNFNIANQPATATQYDLYVADQPSGADPSAWTWTAYSGNPITGNAAGIDITSLVTNKGSKGIKIAVHAGSGAYSSRVFGSVQMVLFAQAKSSYSNLGA